MIATGHILALHLQELGLTSLKAEGGKEGGCWHHSRGSSHARLHSTQRQTHFFFWVLAPTESLGPAADRHQTARPVPESRIRAFTALFTETFYGPPLCMVQVVSFHC